MSGGTGHQRAGKDIIGRMQIIKAHRLSLLRKVGIFLSIPVLAFSLIPTQVSAQAPNCDKNFYSANNILFYDPCSNTCSDGAGSGSLTGPAPSSLVGGTNQEKAWNYFAARGLTPVAAAGAMGNIEHESGFSASVEEASGGGGLGIIQWTGSRRTNLEAAASAAGVSLADNDSALLFQLNYLWDGEYNAMTWQQQVNAETTVEGNTAIASFNSRFSAQKAESQAGNGSTMVFHALVERSNDVPTEADKYGGVGVLQRRIDTANEFLTQFGGAGATGSCGSSIGAGGLTFDQAVEVAKRLVDDWSGVYCGDNSVKGGFYCSWATGYCTAGAAWLAVTTAPDPGAVPGIPNGVDVANRLVSSYSDVYTNVNPDGSNLQPFSIWSVGYGGANGQPGHTGTIVGVGDDGSIVTLEVNWAGDAAGATKNFSYSAGHRAAVFEFPSFEAFKAGHRGYTYNNVATPKDSSIAAEMGKKMTAWMGGN